MAGTVHNVYSELEQRLGETISSTFDELTFRNGLDIPTTFDLEPGANTVSVDIVTGFGQAGLLGREASEIPLVQVNVTKDQNPIVMAVAGYSMTFSSERAYDFSGRSSLISDYSVLMTRRAIDERIHYFAAYGEKNLNCFGFYNNPLVTVVSPVFTPDTATYSDWVTFLMGQILGFSVRNKTKPTTIFISRAMMLRAASALNPNNIDVDALTNVKSRLSGMSGFENFKIEDREESDTDMLTLRSGTAATKDRCVVFKKNPMALARQMEQSIAEMMPEKYIYNDQKGALVYPMFSAASATHVRDTSALSYIDVTKATVPA
jgi:hypothetical protein